MTEHRDPPEDSKVPHRYVAVTGTILHKTGKFPHIKTTILDDGELFSVSHEDGDTIWGMFVEGLGAFNMMADRSQVRELTKDELKRVKGTKMVMVGAHTGKVSYGYEL